MLVLEADTDEKRGRFLVARLTLRRGAQDASQTNLGIVVRDLFVSAIMKVVYGICLVPSNLNGLVERG
jgi:hypothetical protein